MKNQFIFYAISCLLYISACTSSTGQEQLTAQKNEHCLLNDQLRALITLEKIGHKPINQEFELTASVSHNQDEIYRYHSLVSGVVQQINFKLGDFVQKGQILAEVSTPEFNEQKSALLQANSALVLAQRSLASIKNLHKDGVASDRQLIEAQNEVSNIEIEIHQIQETLKLQGANLEKGLLLIKAPESGFIIEKSITQGSQINAGEEDLFVLSNLKKVWVIANVYATQLENIKLGQKVEIESSAYPNKIFHGKIDRLNPVFDEEERVLKAIIEIDNADLLLKPSMMVAVHVHNLLPETALSIPKNAVLFEHNMQYVIVDKGNCEAQAIRIDPIAQDRKNYYVKDQALKDGDQVITRNQLLIYDQLKGR